MFKNREEFVEELYKSLEPIREALEKGNPERITMRPHSDTHMKVTHKGKTTVMPDHEAEAYAVKHLGKGYNGGDGPTLTSHARDTGMSYGEPFKED